MIILKPDAFERCLVGSVLSHFESWPWGQRIRRMYSGRVTREHCEIHYAKEVGQPHYEALVAFMRSGISLFVDFDIHWQHVRMTALKIREKYGVVAGSRNLIHSSDSQEADDRETTFWFKGYPL